MKRESKHRNTRFTTAPVMYNASGVEGVGAFAAADIPQGALVATFKGAWFRKSAKDAPSKRWAKWLVLSFREGKRTVFFRGPMKFVNHGCDPNIEWRGEECYALRDIKQGDELLEDYSRFASPSLRIQCNCGAPNCRGVVTGKRTAPFQSEVMASVMGVIEDALDRQGGAPGIDAGGYKSKRTAHIASYLPYDVVRAARERILYCYESFDVPLVSFSGGKDSLALLMLAIDTMSPMGIKPHVCFMDEEFVPSRTIEFVRWVFFDSPFAHLIVPHWFCWQMDSEIYCAGQARTIVQWGKDREEWLREPPPYALMDRKNVYDIFSPDAPLSRIFQGLSVVSMLGVRASESLNRLATVRHCASSKTAPCFIRGGQIDSVYRAVPMYDWQTKDVLKYLAERNIINPIYYEMLCAGKALRTDTPLHGRRCNIAAFKSIDPPFFDKLCRMFPEVHAASLYNNETKPLAELVETYAAKYGKTWAGMLDYVREEMKGSDVAGGDYQYLRAEALVKNAAKKHARLVRRGLSGVPLLRMWKLLLNRDYDHEVAIAEWSDREREWEGKSAQAESAARAD